MASNAYGVNPLSQAKRYSKAEHKHIQVPRSFAISQYNSGMGETDLMDGDDSRYRIAIRSKKWWWVIFTWLIDVSIVNAWVIYRKSVGTKMPQLDFRREIGNIYIYLDMELRLKGEEGQLHQDIAFP